MNLAWVLTLGALLFSIGIYGVIARRNAVLVLMSIELMLNAVNINLVAFGSWFRDTQAVGQIFALFIIAVAAAEVGIGLAIVLMIFRNRETINLDEVDLLKW
jgi:NADH-quinone oxidoreductase subunit K